MTIVEASEQKMQQERQLKVTVPTETLIRLHSLKILTGKNISDQVLEALNEYFRTIEDDQDDQDDQDAS